VNILFDRLISTVKINKFINLSMILHGLSLLLFGMEMESIYLKI